MGPETDFAMKTSGENRRTLRLSNTNRRWRHAGDTGRIHQPGGKKWKSMAIAGKCLHLFLIGDLSEIHGCSFPCQVQFSGVYMV